MLKVRLAGRNTGRSVILNKETAESKSEAGLKRVKQKI
jgi:hypothetical protein